MYIIDFNIGKNFFKQQKRYKSQLFPPTQSILNRSIFHLTIYQIRSDQFSPILIVNHLISLHACIFKKLLIYCGIIVIPISTNFSLSFAVFNKRSFYEAKVSPSVGRAEPCYTLKFIAKPSNANPCSSLDLCYRMQLNKSNINLLFILMQSAYIIIVGFQTVGYQILSLTSCLFFWWIFLGLFLKCNDFSSLSMAMEKIFSLLLALWFELFKCWTFSCINITVSSFKLSTVVAKTKLPFNKILNQLINNSILCIPIFLLNL